MSNRDAKFYLDDMIDSISKIEKYTKNNSFKKFRKDDKTIDAVIRNIEIIGEAAKNLPKSVRDRDSDIPWNRIFGMRNKVAHEYFGVDIEILWQTINSDIPELKKKIKQLRDY